MKLMIGPMRRDVQRVGEPAPLEHRRDDAERGGDREQVAERGLDRHPDRAEHDRQQDEREADDEDAERQQRARRAGRRCRCATAVKPVTLRSTPYSSSRRSCCARSSRTRSAVAGSSGAVSGTIWTMPVSAVSFGVARATVFDAGDLVDLVGEVVHETERIGGGDDRAGHDERPVEAGAEVLGRRGRTPGAPRSSSGCMPAFGSASAQARGGDREHARGRRRRRPW